MTSRAPATRRQKDASRRPLPSRRWVLAAFAVLVVAILALDQATKAVARELLSTGQDVVVIPGVLALRLVRNVGAAFGILGGHIGAFVACAAVVVAVCVLWLALARGHTRLEVVSLSMVCAGALGNVIDRLWQGCVTDMLRLLFVDFPVFNVADIAITCGFVLFLGAILFGDGALGTGGPKRGSAGGIDDGGVKTDGAGNPGSRIGHDERGGETR